MSNLRALLLLVIVSFATGCFHWSSVSSLDEVDGACRVRVTAQGHEPIVLERPTVADIQALLTSGEHVRVEKRRVNAWATTLIAIPAFLATAFTAFVVVGVGHAGAAGG